VRLFVLFEGNGGLFSFFRRFASDFDGDAVLYVAGDGPTPEQIEPNRESHLTDRIRVVPLASPAERSGRWDQQVRNVRADYLELFGREPNEVSAVAIMTDTDDMGTECTSFYGDIYFAAETDERR
jgi:hypothetical protein